MFHYIYLESVDSTNTWAKLHLNELQDFTCIIAEEQTAGRGRFERRWVSPRGQNIYATLFFKIPEKSNYVSNLGQIMAYSCIKILQSKGIEALFKWPNDIYVNGKKIAGILTETCPLDHEIGVFLGIGMNVNMPREILDSLGQPATSLLDLTGISWDLKPILDELLGEFLDHLKILQTEGFSFFKEPLESLLAFRGELFTSRSIQGICHSLTSEGYLRLLLPSGEFKTLC